MAEGSCSTHAARHDAVRLVRGSRDGVAGDDWSELEVGLGWWYNLEGALGRAPGKLER
jgi:hypothetical protein